MFIYIIIPEGFDTLESGDFIWRGLTNVQDMFLSSLKDLQPELCITAAYGNILPSKFLNIPTLG